MKQRPEWYNKRWIGNLFTVVIGVTLFVVLEHLGDIWRGLGVFFKFLRPVVIGLVIAYVLDPLTKVFENRIFDGVKREKIRRVLSVTFSLILLLLLIVVLGVSLVPQISDSIKMFMENLDGYSKAFNGFISKLQHSNIPINISNITTSFESAINSIIGAITENKEKILSASYGVGNSLMNGFLGIVLAIYFLYGKDYLIKGGDRFGQAVLTKRQYKAISEFLSRCNAIMVRYIAFDLIDGLVVGIVNWIFMLCTGMPYAVLISVVVGVTNLAPTFGPMVGAVIGGFILLLANPWYSFFFLLFTAILQTVDAYIIKPKLFGDQLGVSSVLILVFIIVGGKMFGVVGVLLSIPCAAIADFSYHEFFIERIEEKKRMRELAEEVEIAEERAQEQKLKAELDKLQAENAAAENKQTKKTGKR